MIETLWAPFLLCKTGTFRVGSFCQMVTEDGQWESTKRLSNALVNLGEEATSVDNSNHNVSLSSLESPLICVIQGFMEGGSLKSLKIRTLDQRPLNCTAELPFRTDGYKCKQSLRQTRMFPQFGCFYTKSWNRQYTIKSSYIWLTKKKPSGKVLQDCHPWSLAT